jgi:hypothetical protein
LCSFTTFKGRGWAAFFLVILARDVRAENLAAESG